MGLQASHPICLRLLWSSKAWPPYLLVTFGPSVRSMYLPCPRLTSAEPSHRLVMVVAHGGRQTSPGNARHLHAYARRIYNHVFRIGFGLLRYWPSRPDVAASYAIAVRQAGSLPVASFRPHLAVTPLPSGSRFPPSGSVGDFHPKVFRSPPQRASPYFRTVTRHAGRTKKMTRSFQRVLEYRKSASL